MKRTFLLLALLVPLAVWAGQMQVITDRYNKNDTSAINRNFSRLEQNIFSLKRISGNLDIDNNLSVDGHIGINDTTPDAMLDIVSNHAPSDFIVSVSSQDDTTGNIFSVFGDGSVCIGTTTANGKLTVNRGGTLGNVTLTIDANGSNTYSPVLYFRNTGTALSVIQTSRDLNWKNSNGDLLMQINTSGGLTVVDPITANSTGNGEALVLGDGTNNNHFITLRNSNGNQIGYNQSALVLQSGEGKSIVCKVNSNTFNGVGDVLTINTAGIVSMSSQSYVSVYQANNQTIPDAAWTLVNWDTEVTDTQNEFSVTTDSFTATVAGVYMVSSAVVFDGVADQSRYGMWIKVSGTITVQTYNSAGTGWNATPSLSVPLYLTAGQTVSIYVYIDSDGDETTSEGASTVYLRIAKIQ
jgi:hypothetical protein